MKKKGASQLPNWLRATAVVMSCCCYELCPVLMLCVCVYATGRQKKGKKMVQDLPP